MMFKPRSVDEIHARVVTASKEFLNWEPSVLYRFLPFEKAKDVLSPKELEKPDVEERFNTTTHVPYTEENVLAQMRDYMAFAWEKVEDHRGLSADRSVQKMIAWAWLLGDDDFCKQVEEAPYAPYGAPCLALICRTLDFPIPESETLRIMIGGHPCSDDCWGCSPDDDEEATS